MASKKLKVNVLAGQGLAPKNNGKSDPYCELVVLDKDGNKLGKASYTNVIKGNLNPSWNQLIEFDVPESFAGLKMRVWDKHRFRMDKFMGQVTIKFNTSLLQSSEKLDDWFTLQKKSSASTDIVSGKIHLQIQYGDIVASPTKPTEPKETKDRSNTVIDTPSQVELRVSANFTSDATNTKLKNSTHVVVEEDDDHDDHGKQEEQDYERIREGPAAAALDSWVKGDKDLTFANKNLELTNNSTDYYKLCYAKCNVAVNSGKWYFETRIVTTGQMQIGWANVNYDPKKGNAGGDIWTYDGSRQQKFKNGANSSYGEYWGNGDIIGCAVDIEAKTVQFWRNGRDMGVAFNDLTTGGGRLTPVIATIKRVKVTVNFGKDSFAFPQNSYNMLHSFLTDKEIEQLGKLFNKYRDIGNNDAKSEDPNAEHKESIHGTGLLGFQKDLGIEDDEDSSPLIIMWKLKSETIWEISREDFMNGFTIFGCGTMDKIKAKIKDWKVELKDNTQFRNFYNFVFDYLREDKKILTTEEAVMAWKIVLKERMWALFDEFVEFLAAEDKKAISRDGWQQLWHFMNAYPKSLKEYDASSSSWPIIFDEFVDWWTAKHK